MSCLDRDLRTHSYGEAGLSGPNPLPPDRLYDDARGRRLLPPPEIERMTARERAPLLIAKTLRESQHASRILDELPSARGIWIYRNYRDVARSHMTYWYETVGMKKLQPVLDGATDAHWASERVSEETRAIVREHLSPQAGPADAAALLWYARNALYFEQRLDVHNRVLLVRYEDIVSSPVESFEKIYDFLSCTFPGKRIVSNVHARALGRGRDLTLSPGVRQVCEGMMERLDEAR
jgi:hypothetical protein